jgi:hypothetical protein
MAKLIHSRAARRALTTRIACGPQVCCDCTRILIESVICLKKRVKSPKWAETRRHDSIPSYTVRGRCKMGQKSEPLQGQRKAEGSRVQRDLTFGGQLGCGVRENWTLRYQRAVVFYKKNPIAAPGCHRWTSTGRTSRAWNYPLQGASKLMLLPSSEPTLRR